jgi:RNA polymerase sigma-70 factor (ECF subfamily)
MVVPEAHSIEDILRRLRGGDAAAFNVLFHQHFEPLTRFVARMVDSRHVAAELVQDVFLRLWSGREQLVVRGDLRSYLRRAARNRALDWIGRENLHRKWSESAEHEIHSTIDGGHGADESRFSIMYEVLHESLAAMPERRRAVCQLRWHQGLSPSAIAERLGLSLKTVETHLTRGAKDVRAGLRQRTR